MRKAKTRCDFCYKRATRRFSYMSYLSAREQWSKCWVASCDEHFGCVHWDSMKAAHPDSPIEAIGG